MIAARIILTTLCVLVTAFILMRSLRNAGDSTVESDSVMDWVNDLLRGVGISWQFDSHSIRKTAHFIEYGALGGSMIGAVRSWGAGWRAALLVTLPAGLAVAVCDELLQMLSEGRSCEVRDMALDFCGILVGAVMIYLIGFAIGRRKKDKVYE